MAFEPALEADEQISADVSFSTRPVRRLMLTNRAAYWSCPASLGIGVTTKQVPLSEVVSVTIQTQGQPGGQFVGVIPFVVGLIGVFLTIRGVVGPRDMIPVALFVFLFGLGFFLLVNSGQRRTLVIKAKKTEFAWTEPSASFSDPGRAMFDQARDWAQSNGLRLEAHVKE